MSVLAFFAILFLIVVVIWIYAMLKVIRAHASFQGDLGHNPSAAGSRRNDHTNMSVHPDDEVGEHLLGGQEGVGAGSPAPRKSFAANRRDNKG